MSAFDNLPVKIRDLIRAIESEVGSGGTDDEVLEVELAQAILDEIAAAREEEQKAARDFRDLLARLPSPESPMVTPRWYGHGLGCGPSCPFCYPDLQGGGHQQ